MPRKPAQVAPQGGTPAQAIAEGGLLAHDFQGDSWARWRAILKAAYAEPMTPDEVALFREVADRDPPTRRVRELWVVAGRRAGKDSIASAIATVASLDDYSAFLRTGERATIACLATDRTQAGIVHRYVTGNFETLPALRPLVHRQTDDTLELRNGVEIVITTNSFRAVRGRTVAVAIFDEVAYWRSDDSATPDTEVFAAIEPATLTIPTAMMIGISSPYRRKGLLFEKWRKHYGKPDDDVLVVRGPSRTFNPKLPQRIIDARLAEDPEAGAAEYLAEWRGDVSDFLDRELVESAVDAGVTVRPPRRDIDYRMFADASGGRGDSFAAAVVHAEGELVTIDAVYEARPPFNSTTTVKEVCDLARRYRVATMQGDNYAADLLADAFKREGMLYQTVKTNRSETYLESVALWTAGRVRMVDDRRAVHQLCNLERKPTASGRDKVNHPAGGHDDLANVVCGALVLAATDAHPTMVRREALLADDKLVDLPKWCRSLVGVLALSGDQKLAGIAFFSDRYMYGYPPGAVPDDPPPCVLVDVWEGSTADAEYALYQRLDDLHRAVRPHERFALVPENCLTAFHMNGRAGAVWPQEWLNELPALTMPVRGYIDRGEFRIARAAAERGLPLGAAFTLRPGEKIGDDPLQLAILIGLRNCLMWQAAENVPIDAARLAMQ
ncbi:MAG TPA: hypothetical protein VMB73_25510 [Acetobacteraceae bacterium]|nr:hypothetical protein [Acetobacteraceae bacterium]